MQARTCTPDGHLHGVTCTRYRTDTIDSPDDGHMTARNMQRIDINIHEKELCVKLVICKDLFLIKYEQKFWKEQIYYMIEGASHFLKDETIKLT